MEIPRVLPQAPPTPLIGQKTTVMSRLTCVAARLWKCGTRVRIHPFILHFMSFMCREIKRRFSQRGNRTLSQKKYCLSFAINVQPGRLCAFFLLLLFAFVHPLNVGRCRRVWRWSHGHGLFASPPQPRSLIRLHRGGNSICAYEAGGGGGQCVPLVVQLEMIQKD